MKKYEYMSVDPSNLFGIEPGTRQAPVLLNLLNALGDEGWQAVTFQGDREQDFFCLLMREVTRAA